MLIGGVPIELYGAKQLTVDFAPTAQNTTYEWNAGARLPILVDSRVTFKTLTVVMKVTGENRQEINRNISRLHALAAGEASYQLNGYPGWAFIGVLQEEPAVNKTIDPRVYKLTMKVTGYMRDVAQRVIEIDKQAAQYVFAEGTRDTPIMIEVTPSFDLSQFTLRGIAEREIIINDLTKDSTIYIDGLTGTVTENGQNKFNDVIMFEFPRLKAGEQLLTFSESVCRIVIRYYPMWL